jgi:hypothetical protein
MLIDGRNRLEACLRDAAPGLSEGRFHLLVWPGFAALYPIEVCRPSG